MAVKPLITVDPNDKTIEWDGACHFVVDASDNPNLVDFHTHGLTEQIGTELQFVLNHGQDKENIREIQILFCMVAHLIFNNRLDVAAEEPFALEGWDDCEFKLFPAIDSEGISIVRIIECDMNGHFPEDEECYEPFSLQYMDFTKQTGN